MHRLTPPLWVRIDDRLLHGQVALGWRRALDPGSFWIVDDAVAADPFSAALYEAALTEGATLRVLSLDDFLRAAVKEPPPGRTIVLLRGLAELRRLCEAGFRPGEVNVGGIHAKPGSRRYLDYLFLTPEDLDHARAVIDMGVALIVQDLPSSPRRAMDDVIATGGFAE